MDAKSFAETTSADAPPEGLARPLQALWWMRKGDWERAHATAQADGTHEGAWVHAHLHRVEGDLDNAAYWYGQAKKPVSKAPLDEEWTALVETLSA